MFVLNRGNITTAMSICAADRHPRLHVLKTFSEARQVFFVFFWFYNINERDSK